MAQYAADIEARMHVLDMCDDVSRYYERRAVSTSNYLKRAYYCRQAKVMRGYLTRQSSRFSKILAISESDAKSISESVDIDVATVPNYVDPEVFSPEANIVYAMHRPRLLYVGAMSSWANRDAVEWFVSAIIPSILQETPTAQLQVVGPGTKLLAIDSPFVVLRGFTEDLPSEYRMCDVFVCPLRVGAGIKNKLMEAFASGCAVVSTDVGIEGLDVRNGEHLLVANGPLDFARAVNRLLREPELRSRLGNAARAFAETALSERTMGDSLRAAMFSD
jgi:glycosyltransferase involved in cell wall biosynthesis